MMAKDKENQKRLAREWYLRNKELAKARAKAWHAANPVKSKEIKDKCREGRRDAHNATNRAWFARNSAKRAAYQAKRKAKILQLTPEFIRYDDFWI